MRAIIPKRVNRLVMLEHYSLKAILLKGSVQIDMENILARELLLTE